MPVITWTVRDEPAVDEDLRACRPDDLRRLRSRRGADRGMSCDLARTACRASDTPDGRTRRRRHERRTAANTPSASPSSIGAFTRDEWDSLAGTSRGDPANGYNPFLSYDFLSALEESGCAVPRTGWQGQHLRLEAADGQTARRGALLREIAQPGRICLRPWLGGRLRARRRPLLSQAAGFGAVHAGDRPAPAGQPRRRRRAVQGSARRRAEGGDRAARRFLGACDLRARRRHVAALEGAGFLHRTDQQFHFFNDGYSSYDDFLATLASRKRKALKKERREALGARHLRSTG